MNVRQVAGYANMRFSFLADRLDSKVHIQQIDIGATPNDGRADSIEVALIKVIDNVTECFHAILDEIENNNKGTEGETGQK